MDHGVCLLCRGEDLLKKPAVPWNPVVRVDGLYHENRGERADYCGEYIRAIPTI